MTGLQLQKGDWLNSGNGGEILSPAQDNYFATEGKTAPEYFSSMNLATDGSVKAL